MIIKKAQFKFVFYMYVTPPYISSTRAQMKLAMIHLLNHVFDVIFSITEKR